MPGPRDSKRPLWNAPIHLRQEFQVIRVPREVELRATLQDATCDVYLNGVLIQHLEETGPISLITLSPKQRDALVVGRNVLALRARKLGPEPSLHLELAQLFQRPE
jgi:hypothetical protein